MNIFEQSFAASCHCAELDAEFGELMSAALDGEIDDAEQEILNRHLGECAECRELAQSLESANRLACDWMESCTQPEARVELRTVSILTGKSTNERDERNGSGWVRNFFMRGLPLAVAAAVLIGLFSVAFQGQPKSASALELVEPLTSANEIMIERHEEQQRLIKNMELELRTLRLMIVEIEDTDAVQLLNQQVERLLQQIEQLKQVDP